MGYYHNVESKNAYPTPWKYKAWCCNGENNTDEFHIFVFNNPVEYDDAFAVVDKYLSRLTPIYPIHGNWLWFFDTVHMLYDTCNVHFETGRVADENKLRRYLDGPLAYDCNLVHIFGGFINPYGTDLCTKIVDDCSNIPF